YRDCLNLCHLSSFDFMTFATSFHIRYALGHETRELALERLGDASAPALGDGLRRGVGKDVVFPLSRPSKMPRAADAGEAFGMSKPRFISVSMGPRTTAWTVTPWPARSALSDCVMLNVAAFEME